MNFTIVGNKVSHLMQIYKNKAMPTTIMIDRNGKMRYMHEGYKSGYERDYKKQVKKLIRE